MSLVSAQNPHTNCQRICFKQIDTVGLMVHYAVGMGVVMKEMIRGACARIAQFAKSDVPNGFTGALEVIMVRMVCGLENTANNATFRCHDLQKLISCTKHNHNKRQ